jgi:DNA-binding MarR family transcriptional regulator
VHPIFFGLKRAHHSVLRICRPPLLPLGLTPARFDLLFAVKTHGHRILQGRLQQTLGVGRTTVSRMLASLEKLGLVKRAVDERDRRRKFVALTTRGRWTTGSARRHLIRSGWAQLALDTALGSVPTRCDWSDPQQCWKLASELDITLHGIRREFRDRADLHYPWGEPDDRNPFTWFDEQDFDDG